MSLTEFRQPMLKDRVTPVLYFSTLQVIGGAKGRDVLELPRFLLSPLESAKRVGPRKS